jgi:putative DNA primase/helicase
MSDDIDQQQFDAWAEANPSEVIDVPGEPIGGSELPDIAYAHGQTDAANAARFVDHHHSELLHVPQWRRWLSWDGQRWRDDHGVGVLQRAKRYAGDLWRHLKKIAPDVDRNELAKIVTAIKAANQTAKIHAYLELAAVDERIVCPVDDLNSDPTLLNVVNGTIDLTTGELRNHNSADRITQLAQCAYDSDAACPRWLETIDLILQSDPDLIRYVQQLLGYSLSGDTGEHILPIAFGTGCNGKSTIWNVVAEVLGDYATLATDDLLMGDKHNHPTEKAALYQKRFVAISEPQKNSRLKESRVKELTGDRMITARRMHEDFWSFERTHTFWLSTNHLPRIDGTDEGIWRRVKLLPFSVDLRDKVTPIADFDRWLLQNEGRGIMAWLVRGYLDYAQNGLVEPDCVAAATTDYRNNSDPLGEFLDEYCVIVPDGAVVATELFRVYSETHKGRWTQTGFGRAMAERFEKVRETHGEHRNRTIYKGVRLREIGEDFGSPTTNRDSQETLENKGLRTVAHSCSTPQRDLANSIEDRNNYAQLCASGSDDAKSDPDSVNQIAFEDEGNGDCQHEWQDSAESDGLTRRFCQLCSAFAGFVLADGTVTGELPPRE